MSVTPPKQIKPKKDFIKANLQNIKIYQKKKKSNES